MKTRIDLVPPVALCDIGKVLAFGQQKHGDGETWRKEPVSNHMSAALRHLNAYQRGVTLDEESGLPHLAHAACRLMFVQELTK